MFRCQRKRTTNIVSEHVAEQGIGTVLGEKASTDLTLEKLVQLERDF